MSETYTIGALASAAGVPTTTVRFYERRGLLTPDARTRSKYRVYGADSLDRLRFIRAAQSTGFTLEDIAALLALRDPASGPCGEVHAMIARRLADVEERMADLRRVQEALRHAKKSCESASGACPVMARLTVRNRSVSA